MPDESLERTWPAWFQSVYQQYYCLYFLTVNTESERKRISTYKINESPAFMHYRMYFCLGSDKPLKLKQRLYSIVFFRPSRVKFPLASRNRPRYLLRLRVMFHMLVLITVT